MKEVLAHFLSHDPLIHHALVAGNIKSIAGDTPPDQYFHTLCQNIVSQQLSVKVAEVINGRFAELFADSSMSPGALLALSDDTLRNVGMSWSKVKYLKDLAERTAQGSIPFAHFSQLSDEEIIAELTQVKGIGRWTAEMFLLFTLGRPDVFSLGDLGLRRGVQKLYGLNDREFYERIDTLSEAWKPYRSYASLALWRSLDEGK